MGFCDELVLLHSVCEKGRQWYLREGGTEGLRVAEDIFKNGATTYSSSSLLFATAFPLHPPPLMVNQPDKRLEKLIPLMLVR